MGSTQAGAPSQSRQLSKDSEDEDDDETLPPDEEELAEALVDAMTDASSVDLTLEDGANADNPIEL